MTLALLTLLALGQEEGPPPQPPPEPPPAKLEPAPAPAPTPAPETPPPVGPGMSGDPGWANEGAIAGFALAAVPVALAIAATVALWTHNGTAQDWLTVGAGVSGPLVAMVPSFAGRSATQRYEELEHRPRILRIVGWVMTGYGAFALISGVAGGLAYKSIAKSANFTELEMGAWPTVLGVMGTVTTIFDGLLCGAGVIVLSFAAKLSAERASQYPPAPTVTPTMALVPRPGGGVALTAGLTGSW